MPSVSFPYPGFQKCLYSCVGVYVNLKYANFKRYSMIHYLYTYVHRIWNNTDHYKWNIDQELLNPHLGRRVNCKLFWCCEGKSLKFSSQEKY